jgi:hypothetical protein
MVPGSESDVASSIVDDTLDPDLDSDDVIILDQLKGKQASRAAPGASMDMNNQDAASSSTSTPDVRFREANATLNILNKAYSSKVQKKLRNRFEHFRDQRDPETSLEPFQGSRKRSAEDDLDRDMSLLEGDINDTLNLCQALEESSNFDLGTIVKKRRLDWIQRGAFGYRSSQ